MQPQPANGEGISHIELLGVFRIFSKQQQVPRKAESQTNLLYQLREFRKRLKGIAKIIVGEDDRLLFRGAQRR